MDNKFRSRKFIFALFFSVTCTVALFLDKLGGGEYIAALTVILGLYGVANVGDKYVVGRSDQ